MGNLTLKVMGFNTKEEVSDYYSGDRVECLICHRIFKSLGCHVHRVHGFTVNEYKEMFGLPRGHGLVSEKTAMNCRVVLATRRESGEKRLDMNNGVMQKGQKSKKDYYPAYHLRNMQLLATKGLVAIKEKSLKRINSINWEWYLKQVKKTGVAAYGHRNKEGFPSPWDVAKKKKLDPGFAIRYEKAVRYGKAKKK